MGAWGRSIRRLAGAGVIALALTAAGVVGPELGRGGCGQPGAPCSAFGYAPLRGASQRRGRFPCARSPGGCRPGSRVGRRRLCPVEGWPGHRVGARSRTPEARPGVARGDRVQAGRAGPAGPTDVAAAAGAADPAALWDLQLRLVARPVAAGAGGRRRRRRAPGRPGPHAPAGSGSAGWASPCTARGTGLGTCSVPRTWSRPSSTATCCMRPSTPGPSRTAGWWRRRLRRCRSCCSGRVDRPAERQALFSAALGLEVEPPSEVEPLEPEEASAGFLALSPSVLAGLPRESVR
jgi:hypothetical protein